MSNTMTPKFRVSYPSVFKSKKNDLNGKDEFSLVAYFPKGADLSELKKAAMEAMEEKWPDAKKRPGNMRNPFRKHEEKFKVDEKTGQTVIPQGMEEGGIFINLKSYKKPGLVDVNAQDIIVESDFYGGCYARATVQAAAYFNKGNAGVSFWLQNIQKMADGDPLGSRTRPQDDFAPIEGTDSNASSGDASNLFD